MSKPDHKIVCWGDYAIPVPLEDDWMTIDKNGEMYTHREMPDTDHYHHWWTSGGNEMLIARLYDRKMWPEPGPWYTQLYWIGD